MISLTLSVFLLIVQTNIPTSTPHLLQALGYLNESVGKFVDNWGGSSTCHDFILNSSSLNPAISKLLIMATNEVN
jgi:hypothetical protein